MKQWIFTLLLFLLSGKCIPAHAITVSNNIVSLKSQYEASLLDESLVFQRRREDVFQLYSNALAQAMGRHKKEGNIDGYLVVETEMNRFVSERTIPETSDNNFVNKAITVCNSSLGKIEEESKMSMVRLNRKYVQALDVLIKQLMMADKIAEAKQVKVELLKVQAEIGEVEIELVKKSGSTVEIATSNKTLVIWNTHNGNGHLDGTKSCRVILYKSGSVVWRSKDVELPWQMDVDTNLAIEISSSVKCDKIHVDILSWRGVAGGLSEIQWFENGKNLAEGCKVIASSDYGETYRPETLTDGITSSAQHEHGYWLLPAYTNGWVEVDLTEKKKGPVFGASKSCEKKASGRR